MSILRQKFFAVLAVLLFLISLLSCGHEQKLVSIAVTPETVHFQGFGAQVQFTALGTYIHPPETKDITTQVVWKTDTPTLVDVSNTGFATAINVCGSGQVTANVYSKPQDPTKG